LTIQPHLDFPANLPVLDFCKTLSLQRSNFILDLYAALTLDNTAVPDLLPNSQTSPGTLESLEFLECTQNTQTRV